MQTLTVSMGKITEDIKILLIVLKMEPKKECFHNKFRNENFHFKIRKKYYFLPQNGNSTSEHDQ